MEAVRIFIADDYGILRESLINILGTLGFSVVGSAKDGQEAIEKAPHLQPDVVLMDILMPLINGTVATKRILAQDETVKILALTGVDDLSWLEKMFAAGAVGYVHKQTSINLLTKAILATHYRQPFRAEPCVCIDFSKQFQKIAPTKAVLSNRKKEVLQLIAEGKTNPIPNPRRRS